MSSYEDLENMIHALIMTIAIHEREVAFFRRSAAISSSQEAKTLFLEIAAEMNSHVISLEKRKNKLENELVNFQKNK